jgi:hypothetical protein
MKALPKTTYTFSSWVVDDYGDDKEVKIEFSTSEETLTDMCEKFGDFLRATGFSYVKDVVAYDTWEEDRYDSSEPDDTLDFGTDEEQPDLFDNSVIDFPVTSTTTDYTASGSFSMYPGDIQVTYGGADISTTSENITLTTSPIDATINVRNSIDDASPEEWDALKGK